MAAIENRMILWTLPRVRLIERDYDLFFRYSCEEPRPGGFLCSADRIVHQM
jgi:hypothetical protein